MKNNLNMRIGIVGAGAAGLTAAEALREKGYKNIILLEKGSSAGGKCYSIDYKGRAYELGAGIIAAADRTIIKLAKRFDVELSPVNFRKNVFIDIKTGQPIPSTPYSEKLSLIGQLLMRYRGLTRRYRELLEPGLSGVDPDLCMPFSKWAEKHKIPLIAREFAPFFTGFGYGYFDEVPAAYVLKHYPWKTVKSFIKKSFYRFPGGFQGLWKTVAKNHKVLYEESIKKIQRNQSVKIQTESKELEFDVLILTSPLDEALEYLDASEEEKTLFSKIMHYDYRTYEYILKGFPSSNGFLPSNLTSSRRGHPVLWYKRYEDSNLYMFYVLGDFKMTDEQVHKNIEHVVHQMGGAIEGSHASVHWKHFPHVGPDDMKNGYFDKLENIQGKNHTYYAGELLNFSTVELTAEYAEHLIEKYFA